MKKAYRKPVFYAESFQMVDHIASGCDMDPYNIPHYLQKDSCTMGINEDSIQIFTNSTLNNLCALIAEPSDVELGCYNSFSDPSSVMFSS